MATPKKLAFDSTPDEVRFGLPVSHSTAIVGIVAYRIDAALGRVRKFAAEPHGYDKVHLQLSEGISHPQFTLEDLAPELHELSLRDSILQVADRETRAEGSRGMLYVGVADSVAHSVDSGLGLSCYVGRTSGGSLMIRPDGKVLGDASVSMGFEPERLLAFSYPVGWSAAGGGILGNRRQDFLGAMLVYTLNRSLYGVRGFLGNRRIRRETLLDECDLEVGMRILSDHLYPALGAELGIEIDPEPQPKRYFAGRESGDSLNRALDLGWPLR